MITQSMTLETNVTFVVVRFAALRSDVMVKLELLDNKHVQVQRQVIHEKSLVPVNVDM